MASAADTSTQDDFSGTDDDTLVWVGVGGLVAAGAVALYLRSRHGSTTTPPPPVLTPLPTATTGTATNITSTTAVLGGSVNDNGLAAGGGGSTTWTVAISAAATGAGATQVATGTGTGSFDVSGGVGNLQPLTQYWFNVSATNSAGTSEGGAWIAFTTLAAAVPTFDTWWNTAPTPYRQAVSIFWTLLHRVPTFSGDTTYPIAVMMDAENGTGGFCAATEYASPGNSIEYVGFRIITDAACEFFSDVNKAAGGSGTGSTTYGSSTACGGTPYGNTTAWLSAAGTWIFGSSWTANSGQMANWDQGTYCGMAIPPWANAVQIVLIESAEFSDIIQAQAAGTQPPWGGGTGLLQSSPLLAAMQPRLQD
jgi:hypothetical protein